MEKIILFTGNCFSEERNAAMIAKNLKDKIDAAGIKDYKITGALLISEGNDFRKRGLDVLASAPLPPSGGFITTSLKGFFADIFSGSLKTLKTFRSKIRSISEQIEFAVVVGDVFLFWETKRLLKNKPVLFYVHSKTDYIEPHYPPELWYLKKNADFIFARDAFSAENFLKKGLKSKFLGSVVMDELFPVGMDLPRNKNLKTLGILPGTRDEAYANFGMILNVLDKVEEKENYNYIAALHPAITDEGLSERTAKDGWKIEKEGNHSFLVKGKARVHLARGAFVDVVLASDLLIGLSGAGTEQAAGLGKPVIAFVGSGPQTTKRRMEEQERLLGGSMRFIREYPEGVAGAVVSLMRNPSEREKMGKLGLERMGGPGGASKIADYLFENYINNNK